MKPLALNLGGGPLSPLDALALALRERRPAAVLAGLDALDVPASSRPAVLQCVWFEAGSVRGLRGVDMVALDASEHESLQGLGDIIATVAPSPDIVSKILSDGAFAERDWPRAEPAALELMRDAAARHGRAGDLVRLHLALSEYAPRVDVRVGLVEAAESVAQVLDDRVLHLMVQAFFARVDADFGEDDDARDRVEAVLGDPAAQLAPRACAVARAVRVLLMRRAGTDEEALSASIADMRDAWRAVGWGEGPEAHPGPCWGFADEGQGAERPD